MAYFPDNPIDDILFSFGDFECYMERVQYWHVDFAFNMLGKLF